MAHNPPPSAAPAPKAWWTSTALLLALAPGMAALMLDAAFIAHAADLLGVGGLLATCVLIPFLSRKSYQIATNAPTWWERSLGWIVYGLVWLWKRIIKW